MYRHLLVPLDLTDLAVQVVSNAVALAGSVRARITFLHVAREAQVPGEPGLPAPGHGKRAGSRPRREQAAVQAGWHANRGK